MRVNELIQNAVIEALANGGYTVAEVRENVEVAIERFEQYADDEDD